MSLKLSKKWAPILLEQPETGMGYQIAVIVLNDGRRFENAVIAGGIVTEVAGSSEIPFTEADIQDIKVLSPRQ